MNKVYYLLIIIIMIKSDISEILANLFPSHNYELDVDVKTI